MARQISTPVVLEHQNIVIGSEVVTIKGASIPALIRDVDYIMDYEKGELFFLTSGAALQFSQLIDQNGIDVNYSYEVDFSTPSLLESQLEVFDEVASRISDFKLQVVNSPIANVSRILNQTTQEEYTPTSIHENQITFSGIIPPRTTDLSAIATKLTSTSFDSTYKRHLNTIEITYPSKYRANLNPITSLDKIRSISQYSQLLVIGGEETLPLMITLAVPRESSDIQLFTGARTLKKSTIFLIQGTDYTFTFTNQLADTDYKNLAVAILPSGVQKIRTNNLYLNLGFSENFSLTQLNFFETKTHHINQRITFTTNTSSSLSLLPRYVEVGSVSDLFKAPIIQVIDPSTNLVFIEGQDYTINTTQRTITKTNNSRITSEAIVYYIESRVLQAYFTLVSDIVLVDYVWSNNALNWSSLRKEVPITQNVSLQKNAQFVSLSDVPVDYTKVLMYLKGDFKKTPVMVPISFNTSTLRLHFGPALPKEGDFILEYISMSQPIRENAPYFVTYKYGATRDILRNRFAPLFGLTNTQTQREEVISLAGGSTQAQLSRSPTDLTQVMIFAEGDQQEVIVSTPLSFDGATRTLTFTSISRSGRYVFRYPTDGFDTKNLRTAITKLLETFNEGPTLNAFETIIAGFTSTPPDIESRLLDRFVLPNKQHTIGNQLALSAFESSPSLEDGSSSVTYIPARFNLGALIEQSKEGYIKARSANNIGIQEGTLEFLTGTLFEANDGKLHYFFDLAGKDPYKNRFSIYKSKNNKLNFDIWDNKGQLFRTTADVTQVYNTEIIELKVGATTAKLSYPATPANLDLNDNKTPDLYDGLETKFIIMPETPTFPASYKKASIKVLSYDAATNVVTFEPVGFNGRYIFSYVGGLTKFEETENMIAVTWKLHTLDGQPPFYRLYINGQKIINQTLQDIGFEAGESDQSLYDESQYDVDVFES
jgi:hypothetical protein